MADVFVSYSRRDSDFVTKLAQSIEDRGKAVWLDVEGIADGEVFPEGIKRAIEQSDAFVFVITPASVASSYCENEVEYAREMQKRIVPVLRDPVSDSELPPEIRERSWIPFTEEAQFDASLARLVSALDTDLEAARAHTRWLVKALEWDTEQREKSLLLRGSELKSAEAWLAASPEDADPAPTTLQREYILASREAAARRQRVLVGASLAVALVSVGLLVFALISRAQAVSEQVSARAQALAAESQAQLPDDPEISLILGIRAVREKATPQTLFALRAALDASPFERALPSVAAAGACGANSGLSAVVSPDGRQIAEGACNGSLQLLDAASGRVVHDEHIAGQIATLAYSPNGALLAVGTNSQAMLVNARSGAVVKRSRAIFAPPALVLANGPGVLAVAFSPNGRELATTNFKGVALASVPGLSGGLFAKYPGAGSSMVFTHDGRELIVGGATDNAFRVYDVPSGRLARVVATAPGGGWPVVVALSPNGSELAVGHPSADGNGVVSIYSTRTWAREFDVYTIASVEISSVAFSPDGKRVAIGAEDGTAGVWSLITDQQLVAYDGSTAAVTAITFTDDGRSVLTASNDGTVRVWRASGVEQAFVPLGGSLDDGSVTDGVLTVIANAGRKGWLSSFRLPGGALLKTVPTPPSVAGGLSDDARYAYTFSPPNPTTGVPVSGPVRIYSLATDRVVRTLPPAAVFAATMSPDGSRLFLRVASVPPNGVGQPEVVTIANDHVVKLQLAEPCGSFATQVVFSANDSRVAGASFCGFADVWNATTGRLLRQINEGGEVSAVDLSPDGSRLLVGSWDSRATIWSVAAGGPPPVELIGHTRGIGAAGFVADGSMAVTSSLDHTVRVWDATTGQQLRVLSFDGYQNTVVTNPLADEMALGGNTAPGGNQVLEVFAVCPACHNAKALLTLAEPHVTTRLTTLERTVINGS